MFGCCIVDLEQTHDGQASQRGKHHGCKVAGLGMALGDFRENFHEVFEGGGVMLGAVRVDALE